MDRGPFTVRERNRGGIATFASHPMKTPGNLGPMRWRSSRDRPVHLGPHPAERLPRGPMPDLAAVTPMAPLPPPAGEAAEAMREVMAALDAVRTGPVARVRSDVPADPAERARHLKAFAHFNDATLAGCCALPDAARGHAVDNPDRAALARALATREIASMAAGIDAILADLREAAAAPPEPADHAHALVLLHALPRPPRADEPGCAPLHGAEDRRGALRAAEDAVVLAAYLRTLGFAATAHTATARDVDLHRLAVAAGLALPEGEGLVAPFAPHGFGLAAVTTDMALAPDRPLAALPRWARLRRDPYDRRDYRMGPHPTERLRRRDEPTTYIDEPNVPRVPKRADLFARAQFGDMGPRVQKAATAGRYVMKAAPSAAQRRALGAMVPFQDGAVAPEARPIPPDEATDALKAMLHWLGADAVGASRCPDWAWYSHDARGRPIEPPHDQAVSVIVDQGWETMEGASGDDWISVAQSMRAYLRFAVIGNVAAAWLRARGHPARTHTVMDGEVLQPPLLLLGGLGEVSRIGEVILHPYLGPRLKSGAITTTLPLAHDRPLDFGLQRFCEGCDKCARECPSGAITAGPKTMFNGYEIWKSDSQKCATYRMTTEGGAMCGRCMKTCPWNLEGLFAEAPVRWAAMAAPSLAPALARLDDALGRGGLNPVKKWWWDLELKSDGAYRAPAAPVNERGLSPGLRVRPEDQTLAVYPAPLAAHPHPYPDPMDREAGIAAREAMVSAAEHRRLLALGETRHLHRRRPDADAPVIRLEVAEARALSPDVTEYVLRRPEGGPLPPWEAGAHVDVVVAPEYLRSYSLTGDPADRDAWRIGVLREDGGRGGSALLHRVFAPGRPVFAAPPANHFPLHEGRAPALLFGGGIGITPMIAMAHALHRRGTPFRLHYSAPDRARAAYAADLAAAPWADRATLHLSAEGTRLDLAALDWPPDAHAYACGPDAYMAAAMDTAARAGIPEERRHLEHFAVPDVEEGPRHPFVLRLPDGREIAVAEDEPATDALLRAGVRVDVKCADGLCGACACEVVSGEVDHRDFVLSAAERRTRMILCRSRAAEPGGTVGIGLPGR